MTRKNITSLVIVVVIGLIIQGGLLAMDCGSTPADTAVSFARAYYRLDPSMTQWMCGASSEASCKSDCVIKSETCPKAAAGFDSVNCPKAASDNDPVNCPKTPSCDEPANCSKTVCCKEEARRVKTAVDNYLYDARLDAEERGFGENFAKYKLYHIETRTEYLDDATALVHLTARSRMEINPLYAYVAQLFRIGDTYEVDGSIRVKLEEGQWRVCKSSLSSLKMS